MRGHLEDIRNHYEIEKQLAARLRNSTRQERAHLYTDLYDELFARVPGHALLAKKSSSTGDSGELDYEMEILRGFVKQDSCFLEVGAGDCALSLRMAEKVKTVYAVDVSQELTKNLITPPNFKLIISDGCSIPVPPGTVDVVFSNQLMEHLHPEDAMEQLRNIHTALAPGGIYLCITPNRLRGPHDISRQFDRIATGFHLKEYTVTELASYFKKTGFTSVKTIFRVRGSMKLLPAFPAMLIEMSIGWLPYRMRRALASLHPVATLLGVKLVGIK